MGGVSSVFGPVYRLPCCVGRLRGDKGNVGREIDEVAPEELEVGVDRADLDLPVLDELREARALRSGKREVDLLRQSLLEQLHVARQCEHGLHDVQIAHTLRRTACKRLGKEIRLLLIVALEADAVARLDHGLHQLCGAGGIDPLALRERGARASRAACFCAAVFHCFAFMESFSCFSRSRRLAAPPDCFNRDYYAKTTNRTRQPPGRPP